MQLITYINFINTVLTIVRTIHTRVASIKHALSFNNTHKYSNKIFILFYCY